MVKTHLFSSDPERRLSWTESVSPGGEHRERRAATVRPALLDGDDVNAVQTLREQEYGDEGRDERCQCAHHG